MSADSKTLPASRSESGLFHESHFGKVNRASFGLLHISVDPLLSSPPSTCGNETVRNYNHVRVRRRDGTRKRYAGACVYDRSVRSTRCSNLTHGIAMSER